MLLSDAFRIGGLMPAASLETTLELWSTTLRQAKHRIRPLFAAPSVAASAHAFLDGLLGAERRKTGWMGAEGAGEAGPWRQPAIRGGSHWNPDALRHVVRDHVIETLGAPEAVLVIDETGFLKQGHASCGVGRQYTGSAGKITNCQIGVFAASVSDKGHAFVDRQLYLPKAWTGDPARMTAAHGPAGITFAQATTGARHGRAGDRGGRAICLGSGRHRLRRGRDRAGAAAGRQGLCSRRHGPALILVLGGRGRGIGHGRGDRDSPRGGGLDPPLGGGGYEGAAPVRLGLSGAGFAQG